MKTTALSWLKAGRIYRTSQLADRSSNPTRLAAQLVKAGHLKRLQGGLYWAPKSSRWGETLPNSVQLLNVWLGGVKGRDWVFTGSEAWNSLGLGANAVHAQQWVYNNKRSGLIELGGHRFRMGKVPFPKNPPLEWFVVDLFNHAKHAAVDTEEMQIRLNEALAEGRFDTEMLRRMANKYGRKATIASVEEAVQ